MRAQTVLDRKYQFEYDLGRWSFGTCSVVKVRENGSLRTCKTVPKGQLRSCGGNVVQRLFSLQELQHPHICNVTDVLEDQHNLYVLFDFCPGGDVADWMERMDESNWLQEQTVATYIRQALLALTHAHAAGVFHRDLQPSSLLLTSKLPDAKVLVTDFGLAGILDPDNAIAQATECPNPFVAPEVLSGNAPARAQADTWCVGAIAHALLVGRPPSEGGSVSSGLGLGGSWSLGGMSSSNRGRKGSKQTSNGFASLEDSEAAWAERSPMARDFVMRLLQPANRRPTAAKSLNHPWLKGLMPLSGPQWRADTDAAREIRHKTLCYTLAVLLVPVVVPYRDFEQLRVLFQQGDPDHDGFVSRAVGQRLLLTRCNLPEAVAAAVSIADVGKVGVLDLCATACADVIAREFFAAGPTGAPLAGPFRATDLVPRMVARFFEVFGDRRQPAVMAAGVRAKMRTATARDFELYAKVNYDNILACLPEDRSIDGPLLTTQISSNAGRGLPLGENDLSPIRSKQTWGSGFFGTDLMGGIFQSCAAGGDTRDESPHSIRIM